MRVLNNNYSNNRNSGSAGRVYAFDAVFDGEATNEEVYESVFLRRGNEGGTGDVEEKAKQNNVVETVLSGSVAKVFAYGATESGKMHTMIGRKSDQGMMMRSLGDVFVGVKQRNEERRRKMETLRRKDQREEHQDDACIEEGFLEVRCSYVEVYNENLYDLLTGSTSTNTTGVLTKDTFDVGAS